MALRIFIWIISALAALPVLLTAYVVARTLLLFPKGTLWNIELLDVIISSGNRMVIGDEIIPFYPRLSITIIGVIGVICLFTFIYFTFHRPYQS